MHSDPVNTEAHNRFLFCSVVVSHVFEVLLFPPVSPTSFVFILLHFRHGVSPFTPLKGMLIQGPIFMSFFFAVSYTILLSPSFVIAEIKYKKILLALYLP